MDKLKKSEAKLNDILYKKGFLTLYDFQVALYEAGVISIKPIPVDYTTNVGFVPEDRFDQMRLLDLGGKVS